MQWRWQHLIVVQGETAPRMSSTVHFPFKRALSPSKRGLALDMVLL